jgi:hypothetical protein
VIVNSPNSKNTIQAPLAAKLAEFEQHKQSLIDILRKVHGGNPDSKPFEADEAWRSLARAAQLYFSRPDIKRKTLPSARRVERLRDLEKALGRTRLEVHKATKDYVGWDLFRGWWAESSGSASFAVRNADEAFTLNPFVKQIRKVMADLAALEAAASRAARDLPTKAGPSRGTGILSISDILTLKAAYEGSTGLKVNLGTGPFAEFTENFLIAVGMGAATRQDYVFEVFKYARKQLRKSAGK